MVSGVFVPDCIWGKILWWLFVYSLKNVKDVFCILVYLSFIQILKFKIFIVGIYLVTYGFPMILCFILVIWKV